MNRIRISLSLALLTVAALSSGCAHDSVYIRYEQRCAPPPPVYYCPPPPPHRHVIIVPPHRHHHHHGGHHGHRHWR